jgi:CBS domain-containing protein
MQRHLEILARDFMGKGVLTVNQESNVASAIKIMEDRNIGSVVVNDNLGPCGVFTERDLLSKVVIQGKDPEETRVSEVTSPKFPSIDSSMTVSETAAAMVEMKSRLMVFEDAILVGIVTPTDLVKALEGVDDDFSILKVISTNVTTVFPDTAAGVVVHLMNDRKIGSVIVADRERWKGIFTERDLLKRILAPRRGLDTRVGEVASSPLITKEPGLLGREAAGTMALHRVKRLPLLLGEEGVGIVTARDLVEAYSTATRPTAPRVNWVQWN